MVDKRQRFGLLRWLLVGVVLPGIFTSEDDRSITPEEERALGVRNRKDVEAQRRMADLKRAATDRELDAQPGEVSDHSLGPRRAEHE